MPQSLELIDCRLTTDELKLVALAVAKMIDLVEDLVRDVRDPGLLTVN